MYRFLIMRLLLVLTIPITIAAVACFKATKNIPVKNLPIISTDLGIVQLGEMYDGMHHYNFTVEFRNDAHKNAVNIKGVIALVDSIGQHYDLVTISSGEVDTNAVYLTSRMVQARSKVVDALMNRGYKFMFLTETVIYYDGTVTTDPHFQALALN